MHDSFYRTGPLYEYLNPVRLLNLSDEKMEATIRRGATEAIARAIWARDPQASPPPLNVFLSHAKRDGTQITEAIRDGVRNFSQIVAWYDANDLPYGAAWESPMKKAAAEGTAAMDGHGCLSDKTVVPGRGEAGPHTWAAEQVARQASVESAAGRRRVPTAMGLGSGSADVGWCSANRLDERAGERSSRACR